MELRIHEGRIHRVVRGNLTGVVRLMDESIAGLRPGHKLTIYSRSEDFSGNSLEITTFSAKAHVVEVRTYPSVDQLVNSERIFFLTEESAGDFLTRLRDKYPWNEVRNVGVCVIEFEYEGP